jgi:hypothetical protein
MVYPDSQIFWVAAVGLGALLSLCVADSYLILRSGQPAGRWIEAWARRYPVIAFFLVAVLGLLIGHFYWSTPEPCPTKPGQYGEPDCIRGSGQVGRANVVEISYELANEQQVTNGGG